MSLTFNPMPREMELSEVLKSPTISFYLRHYIHLLGLGLNYKNVPNSDTYRTTPQAEKLKDSVEAMIAKLLTLNNEAFTELLAHNEGTQSHKIESAMELLLFIFPTLDQSFMAAMRDKLMSLDLDQLFRVLAPSQASDIPALLVLSQYNIPKKFKLTYPLFDKLSQLDAHRMEHLFCNPGEGQPLLLAHTAGHEDDNYLRRYLTVWLSLPRARLLKILSVDVIERLPCYAKDECAYMLANLPEFNDAKLLEKIPFSFHGLLYGNDAAITLIKLVKARFDLFSTLSNLKTIAIKDRTEAKKYVANLMAVARYALDNGFSSAHYFAAETLMECGLIEEAGEMYAKVSTQSLFYGIASIISNQAKQKAAPLLLSGGPSVQQQQTTRSDVQMEEVQEELGLKRKFNQNGEESQSKFARLT